MNPISIYVAVGAITFVECHVGYNFLEPPRRWQYAQFPKEEWKSKDVMKEKKKRDKGTIHGDVERFEWNGEIKEKDFPPEADNDDEDGLRTDFSQGFRQLAHIYDQCKTKVDKRIKKMIKTTVKSRVGKQLSEFKEYVISLYKCVKVYSFRSLDEALEKNFVPLMDYAYFVKDGANATEEAREGQTSLWGGRAGHHRRSLSQYVTEILSRDWTALISDRLYSLLRSHSLKFRVDKSLGAEGRGRRRDHRMFAMMVMGFMIMASILIPMGFQFLTVLGGKSLLMAKMALIMSAINGLKKIATSNLGYGFYHTANDGHHHDHVHHGFHEKLFHVNPQANPNQYPYNLQR